LAPLLTAGYAGFIVVDAVHGVLLPVAIGSTADVVNPC
jgi:hypothetical protein